jgi:nicotinamide-nucleotide amidase
MKDDIAIIAGALTKDNRTLVTAESCTGGMVAAQLTTVAGSSEWFEGAFITYRLRAKQRLLGVSAVTLERFGAVSEPVAREMAMGALQHSDADISVAVTGVAGPGGSEPLLPVGTVWFAWCDRHGLIQSAKQRFTGTREDVRKSAVKEAIAGLASALSP